MIKYARKCSECGCGMNAGYVVGGGDNYYCSEDCLHKHFTPEEWIEECSDYDEESDEYIVGDTSYYTEWDIDDDDDMQWIEINGVLLPNPDY